LDRIKIISVNINKGCPEPRLTAFQGWINKERPDFIVCQESSWCRAGKYGKPPLITGYLPIKDMTGRPCVSDSQVACYAKDGTQCVGTVIERRSADGLYDRWQVFTVNGITIHNVYLPSNNTKKDIEGRHAFLRALATQIKPHTANIVVGDFNMAPRSEDAPLCATRAYSSPDGWAAFKELRERARLYDATETGILGEFTNAHWRFRCDLALASIAIGDAINARYEHRTDLNRHVEAVDSVVVRGFTDHSAIVLEIDLTRLPKC
jgi:exonuclease III